MSDAQDLMTVSHSSPTTTSSFWYDSASGSPAEWGTGRQGITVVPAKAFETKTPTQEIREAKWEEKKMAKTRLIRYTVVDPDPILAEHKPEIGILCSGTVMLNGMDDRGFVMDLAPKVNEKLAAHNEQRQAVEYEDEEGRTKKLKPVRLGQLDVVLELLKAY